MQAYDAETEALMKKYYASLSEKDQRRYAAVEAQKLGHGGIQYIANLLGCHRNTITAGLKDLADLSPEGGYDARIRRPGGGRKSYAVTHPGIDEAFVEMMGDHTAGDPMDAQIKWTNRSQQALADQLASEYDIHVSTKVIRQLLSKHGYRRRQLQKKDDQA
jgi:transposase